MTVTRSLAVDAMLPASPAKVFEALTRPDMYRLWMGPEGSTTEITEMNPVPGGRLAFTVGFADGMSVPIEGEYLSVDPPRQLSHTWMVDGDDHPTKVTIDLNPTEQGTHLVLVHDGFTDENELEQNEGGWRHQLERLEAVLSS